MHVVAVQHLIGDERGRVVRRNAHVLLVERLLVGAARLDEVEIGGLVHRLAFVALGELRLELGQEAVVEGVLECDLVEAELLRVAGLDLVDELLEERVAAAGRGEDLEFAAPRDARIGDGVELARVGMQGELVEDAVAALARLGVGVRGHRVDAQPVAHLQHVGRRALAVDHALAEVLRARVENAGEGLAVLEEEPRLDLVAARNPRIELGGLERLAADQPVGRRPRPPDLTALDRQLQARRILHPPFLVRQEQGVLRLDLRVSHG